LEAGRVRYGKRVLDDLAFSIAVKQGLAEIQEGETPSLEEVKNI